jgi:hypothetical protein
VNDVDDQRLNKPEENNAIKDFDLTVDGLCEKALNDAKAQLHPLLRNVELSRLEKRSEFLQAFRLALERWIARSLATWKPGLLAVYRFDETRRRPGTPWDGSIHLLVKVPRLSNTLKTLGKKLDRSLVRHLNQLGWSRFQKKQSILELQQVTPNELRHGVSYGAMFCAVYNVPVKVWPQNGMNRMNNR